jgi:arsenate reductase (glutaredoxin)
MEFYGYKKCSTCREAHKYLSAGGMNLPFVDFVAQPPTKEVLQSWVEKLGQGVLPFVNTKGTRYRELGLKDQSLSEEEWMDLLSKDGKLLKRPVLVTDEEIVVGFDKAAYDRILQRG